MESEERKLRLFVDIDGTLAEFKAVDTLEILYEKGYFKNLQPQQSVVDAVNYIVENEPNIEVFILSSVLSDSKYALQEKNEWIDKYLPNIPKEKRIFPPCGEDKKDYIDGGVDWTDFLLDDYSKNLHSWEPPAKGIKVLNGINGTNGSWTKEKVSIDRNGKELAEDIIHIMNEAAVKNLKNGFYATKTLNDGREPGYMVEQWENGKKVCIQFIKENIYKDYCEWIGCQPQIQQQKIQENADENAVHHRKKGR